MSNKKKSQAPRSIVGSVTDFGKNIQSYFQQLSKEQKSAKSSFQIGSDVFLDLLNDVSPETTRIEDFILYAASMSVIVSTMCQIRSLYPTTDFREVDKSPSFAFYRKRVLSRFEIRVVLAGIVALMSLGVMLQD